MAGLSDLLDTGPFKDLLATYQLTPQWSCLACGTSWSGGIEHNCTAAPKPDRAFEHFVMVKTMRAFRIRKPYLLGVDTRCACHSAPNPAGRDYRRRTKHRRKR